jgi:hypothetical protein
MEKTGFFVIGLALVAVAVIVSVIGLRYPRFPGSRAGMTAVVALFVLMVAGATTGAVINAREEQNERAVEEQGRPRPRRPRRASRRRSSRSRAPPRRRAPA